MCYKIKKKFIMRGMLRILCFPTNIVLTGICAIVAV